MNLNVSASDINTFKVWNTMGKPCQIFKMSNIWANREVLFPKVKVFIFLIVFNSKQGSYRSNLNSEKRF